MIKNIQKKFIVCKKNNKLFQIQSSKQTLKSDISYLLQNGFVTLSQIACSDYIEENIFTLNYILTTVKKDMNLMVKIDIQRDTPKVDSLWKIFPQSEVMERDLHEMFGIVFDGNNTLYDFALENWEQIPPLRREFDTLKFVNEAYEFKKGRDDNKDVKAETKRRKALEKKQKEVSNG